MTLMLLILYCSPSEMFALTNMSWREGLIDDVCENRALLVRG